MSLGVINYTDRDVADLLARGEASIAVVDAPELERIQAAASGDDLGQGDTGSHCRRHPGHRTYPDYPCVSCAASTPLPAGVAAIATITIHWPDTS